MSASEIEPAASGLGALVSAVYQPVMELEHGGIVGYEALARGPQGGQLERPDRLLSAARRAGLLAQVDWEMRLAAVAGALDARLDRCTTLFVNMEPEAVGPSANGDGRAPDLWSRAEQSLSVAVELPAGALRARPRELVRAADACRDRGWAVVLDDVGADRHSLAVLPLVAPDAIKLDLRATRGSGAAAPTLSDIATAVWSEQERTGAAIIAEGIETEQQLEQARGIGATLGQGWLWGRPGPLPSEAMLPIEGGPLWQELRPPASRDTPFELLAATRPLREAPAARMATMSGHIERATHDVGAGAIVLTSLDDAAGFDGAARDRYRDLASRTTLVAVFGSGISATPAIGVFGTDVATDDPLHREWAVIALAPHYAAALVARASEQQPDDVLPRERRYDYVLTHDRDLVVAAARSLAARLG
ncbi:EAL domain-containing protein [Conexibacter sp. CPCC 206217]|uniref:sensor domain-containing phosphodiesterase n=1 Tax=Conexibacter sp. CPCC 206217 TaxID=3064574 RepID=UPI00272081A4|nr:EAL domain-containing protein [Conexibacter sp. CPCC 206217]MDO8212984.1 EAL domain-containing protein [Conexibacter sp. CPCC 206217]